MNKDQIKQFMMNATGTHIDKIYQLINHIEKLSAGKRKDYLFEDYLKVKSMGRSGYVGLSNKYAGMRAKVFLEDTLLIKQKGENSVGISIPKTFVGKFVKVRIE